jgi:hypothetical protein
MSDGVLDGATDPGEPNAYPANAGEFAARWNAWTPAQRDTWLGARIESSQRSAACYEQDHVGRLGQLDARIREAKAEGVEAAQDRLVNRDQFSERTLRLLDELAAEYRSGTTTEGTDN